MLEILYNWLYFFCLIGSAVLFPVNYSRLAKRNNKNHLAYGFLGLVIFLMAQLGSAFLVQVVRPGPSFVLATLILLFAIWDGCSCIFYFKKAMGKDEIAFSHFTSLSSFFSLSMKVV